MLVSSSCALFCNGRLEYWALPEEVGDSGKGKSVNMTGERYNHFVKSYLAKWRRKLFPKLPRTDKLSLIKDFERFLRWGRGKKFDNLKAEREAGFETVKRHHKLLPDFNAIEGWWRVLQDRLSLTAPTSLESRAQFVKRLRRTVTWNASAHGKKLCCNQKDRAKAVKKLRGARCKW